MATYKEAEYGSYDWLRREVGGYLGLGYNPGAWTVEQSSKIDSIVQSGIMQFYYHQPIRDGDGNLQPHMWSFLSPAAELEIEDAVREYELPEDFAGIIEGFTVGE